MRDSRVQFSILRRRILSGDGRGLQNRQRVRESVLGWVRPPHASANSIWDFGFRIWDFREAVKPSELFRIINPHLTISVV